MTHILRTVISTLIPLVNHTIAAPTRQSQKSSNWDPSIHALWLALLLRQFYVNLHSMAVRLLSNHKLTSDAECCPTGYHCCPDKTCAPIGFICCGDEVSCGPLDTQCCPDRSCCPVTFECWALLRPNCWRAELLWKLVHFLECAQFSSIFSFKEKSSPSVRNAL